MFNFRTERASFWFVAIDGVAFNLFRGPRSRSEGTSTAFHKKVSWSVFNSQPKGWFSSEFDWSKSRRSSNRSGVWHGLHARFQCFAHFSFFLFLFFFFLHFTRLVILGEDEFGRNAMMLTCRAGSTDLLKGLLTTFGEKQLHLKDNEGELWIIKLWIVSDELWFMNYESWWVAIYEFYEFMSYELSFVAWSLGKNLIHHACECNNREAYEFLMSQVCFGPVFSNAMFSFSFTCVFLCVCCCCCCYVCMFVFEKAILFTHDGRREKEISLR